jgi:NAD(P)-dependent dehydrogenase (short-subunit alcohol dehydrogenase family)
MTTSSRATPGTWLITGASAGLGLLLTERLLARGDRVAAATRRAGALDALAGRYAGQLRELHFDMTDTASMRAAINAAFADLGRIDVIVSNAGYGLFGAAEEVTDAQIERQLATNLTGPIQLIRACLPHLRSQGGGRIVQVSSEGGQIAYPNFSLYHASKWGIEGFVEALAQEVAPFGIDCLLVEPGPTATQFGSGLDHAPVMPEYEDTPAGTVRRLVNARTFPIKGDAARTVDAMIRTIDSPQMPRRLPLGSSAWDNIASALNERQQALASQREIAYSADVDMPR